VKVLDAAARIVHHRTRLARRVGGDAARRPPCAASLTALRKAQGPHSEKHVRSRAGLCQQVAHPSVIVPVGHRAKPASFRSPRIAWLPKTGFGSENFINPAAVLETSVVVGGGTVAWSRHREIKGCAGGHAAMQSRRWMSHRNLPLAGFHCSKNKVRQACGEAMGTGDSSLRLSLSGAKGRRGRGTGPHARALNKCVRPLTALIKQAK